MGLKTNKRIKSSEITPESVHANRREFLKKTGLLAGILMPAWSGACDRLFHSDRTNGQAEGELSGTPGEGVRFGGKTIRSTLNRRYSIDEPKTSFDAVTGYNNFYEFSTDKESVAPLAKDFVTEPWSITVGGEVEKPARYGVEDLIDFRALEERIYRLRCVEGWSMVIPWVGVPLQSILKKVQPTSKARYVQFTTLYDPEQMPGQKRRILDWPYVEGLRLDEALHPLTILSVGLYGKTLLPQNGAPVRLVVPWKYGFKSIKSIVKIELTVKRPVSTWMASSPYEYGFYANVNPNVDHPRWSQATERRIGDLLKRETLMFNGYGEEVAHLYSNLDLKKNF